MELDWKLSLDLLCCYRELYECIFFKFPVTLDLTKFKKNKKLTLNVMVAAQNLHILFCTLELQMLCL